MSFKLVKTELISKVAEKSPLTIKLLAEYGLNCANCFMSQFETVEMGAMAHGMTNEEIEIMISEINEHIRDK
jgi:hybrid cluster-associated redox disulfide protein